MDMDLMQLPKGERYEDRYGGYMKLLADIALCTDRVVNIDNAPASWWPILWHLNCNVKSVREEFEHCHLVAPLFPLDLTRTAVEVLSAFRPECSDALWKCDMQWKLAAWRCRQYEDKEVFVVNVNGAYHRDEVMDYMKLLGEYVPQKRNVVLVPCAADKPYPSTLHKSVLEMMPDDFYMMNVTGVLGLVPQDLWDIMPHYDCGVPNDWRVFHMVRNYFTQFPHDRIVVYLDYYGLAVYHALKSIGQVGNASFVNALRFYFDYLPLQEELHLILLGKTFDDPNFPNRIPE